MTATLREALKRKPCFKLPCAGLDCISLPWVFSYDGKAWCLKCAPKVDAAAAVEVLHEVSKILAQHEHRLWGQCKTCGIQIPVIRTRCRRCAKERAKLMESLRKKERRCPECDAVMPRYERTCVCRGKKVAGKGGALLLCIKHRAEHERRSPGVYRWEEAPKHTFCAFDGCEKSADAVGV